MVNRHKSKENKAKSKKSSKSNKTYSMPKTVAKPKLTKQEKEEKQRALEEKQKALEINRENNENDIHNTWVHNIQKLSKHDLGVINRPEDYPSAKKDRSYNNGVQRAKDDLKLLDYLLVNLKPHYKQQITSSSEFKNIIKMYLGISAFGDTYTREEKDVILQTASQLLIYSLAVIKRNMPHQFSEVLFSVGKPYYDLIEAISNFSRSNNIKSVPKIDLPDGLR